MSIYASIPRARCRAGDDPELEEELAFMWNDDGPTVPVVNLLRNGRLISSTPLPLDKCPRRAAIALERGADPTEVGRWLDLVRTMNSKSSTSTL